MAEREAIPWSAVHFGKQSRQVFNIVVENSVEMSPAKFSKRTKKNKLLQFAPTL
jgi:hypothetical protein